MFNLRRIALSAWLPMSWEEVSGRVAWRMLAVFLCALSPMPSLHVFSQSCLAVGEHRLDC